MMLKNTASSGEGKRILIVEDEPSLQIEYGEAIRYFLPNVEIDQADDRSSAFQSLNNKTYHLALLDINLNQEERDTGGLDVLDQIRAMNEGTLAVMLSSTPNIHDCIRAIRSRICVDFIHKLEPDPEILLEGAIQAGLEKVELVTFGAASSLTALLASPKNVMPWEYDAARALSGAGGGGMTFVSEALETIFGPLLPLLRPKECDAGLAVDVAARTLSGVFWSKALGFAVSVSIQPVDAAASQPPGEILRQGELGKSSHRRRYEIRSRGDLPRDHFVAGIRD